MEPVLHVADLSLRFGATPALRALTLTLHRGQICGLLGANGAGKTTCLHAIAGCLRPDAGKVVIDGWDLDRHPRRAKASLGYLPERAPLYPELRVDEYLHWCARLRQVPRARWAGAVARVLEDCQLQLVARRRIGALSKGTRQRVGIAQALVHDPALLLLDEPSDGLDPLQAEALHQLLRQRAPVCAILLSSHRLAEVEASCNQVAILHQGRLLHQGSLVSAERPVLHVALATPSGATELAAMPEVARVEPGASGRFRIWLAEPATPAQLVRALVARGLDLTELTPEPDGVRQLFFRCLGLDSPS